MFAYEDQCANAVVDTGLKRNHSGIQGEPKR